MNSANLANEKVKRKIIFFCFKKAKKEYRNKTHMVVDLKKVMYNEIRICYCYRTSIALA